MIRYTRHPKPEKYEDSYFLKEKTSSDSFFKRSFVQQKQASFKGINYSNYSFKNSILLMFFHHCSFCGRNEIDNDLQVSPFRPQSKAIGLNGNEDELYYYWLSLEWRNLITTCQECNKYKSSHFPVVGKRIPPLTNIENTIANEKTLLIDPCEDDPEEHLTYNNNGELYGTSKKGKTTISILNLNRTNLVSNRQKNGESFRQIVLALKKLLSYRSIKSLATTLSIFFYDPKTIHQILVDHKTGVTNIDLSDSLINIWTNILETSKNKNGSISSVMKILIEEAFDMFVATHLSDNSRTSFIGYKRWIFSSWYYKLTRSQKDKLDSISHDKYLRKYGRIRIKKDLKKTTLSNKVSHDKYLLHSIKIENFKNINELELDFYKPKSEIVTDEKDDYIPCLFLLGENGSGKSSILKAICLSVIGKVYRQEIVDNEINSYIRYGKSKKCLVKVTTNEGKDFELIFDKNSNNARKSTNGPNMPILAYGSTRLMSNENFEKEDRTNRTYSVDNLFNPLHFLVNAESWLLSLKRGNTASKIKSPFDTAATTLKAILGLDEGNNAYGNILVKRKKLYFQKGVQEIVELKHLSDGYKILFALSCDIMMNMRNFYNIKNNIRFNQNYATMSAIILIDEIGNHLHPRWKKRILNSLRKAFGHVQFIVSSHEPLCLRGIRDLDSICILKYDYNESTVTYLGKDYPNPRKYRVDQLLTSPFFGMYSTVNEDQEEVLDKYYELLAKKVNSKKLTAKEKKQLLDLSNEVNKGNHFTNSLREEIVYQVVDELIAKTDIKTKINELSSSAIERVQKVWGEYEMKFNTKS